MRWLMVGSSAYYTIILAHQCPIRHHDAGLRGSVVVVPTRLPNTDKEEPRHDSLEILHAFFTHCRGMRWSGCVDPKASNRKLAAVEP